MSQQRRDERIALNEAHFREINDRLRHDLGRLRERPAYLQFVCECGLVDCREQLLLTDEEYADVRRDPMQFVVVPGHDLPMTEDVVQLHERFAVVRKYANVRHIVEGQPPSR